MIAANRRENLQANVTIGRIVMIQMIHPTRIFLTAAFSLLSVLAIQTGYAQAVPIPAARSTSIKISALPFNITAPGTYVLTGNLTASVNAITVNAVVSGKVIIDLNGWTLTSLTNQSGIVVQSSSNVTIRNGTLTGFGFGVYAGFSKDVDIQKITFRNSLIIGCYFNGTNLSNVSNCTFINDQGGQANGIQDYDTQGGNHFNNNSFDGHQIWTIIVWNSVPSIIEQYEVSPPPPSN